MVMKLKNIHLTYGNPPLKNETDFHFQSLFSIMIISFVFYFYVSRETFSIFIFNPLSTPPNFQFKPLYLPTLPTLPILI